MDELPVIKTFNKQDWQFLLEYYQWKYGRPLKPVKRRNGRSIPEDTVCPLCGVPHHFIYDNNGGNGQSVEIRESMASVIAEAEKLGYPIDETAIGGGSAGGCLALLYAYRDAETSPVSVKMVFEAVGPSSFIQRIGKATVLIRVPVLRGNCLANIQDMAYRMTIRYMWSICGKYWNTLMPIISFVEIMPKAYC